MEKIFNSRTFFLGLFSSGIYLIYLSTPVLEYLTALGFLLSLISFFFIFKSDDFKVYLKSSFEIPFFILILSAFISLVKCQDIIAGIKATGALVISFLLFYLILFYFKINTGFISSLFKPFIFAFSIIIIMGISQFISGDYNHCIEIIGNNGTIFQKGRLTSIFFFPNTFAAYLVLALPIFFTIIIIEKFALYQKIVMFLIGFTGIFCLFFTYSRAAWISAIFSLLLLLYLANLKYSRIIVIILLVCSFIICITGILIWPDTFKFYLFHSYSDRSRLLIWNKAFHMFLNNPFTGIGIGNFYHVYPLYLNTEDIILPTEPRPWHAHNMFLNLSAEMGIPGLISFCWFIIKVFQKLLHPQNLNNRYNLILYGIISGLSGFLIFNQVDFVIDNIKNGIFFFIVLAFGIGLTF